MMKMNQRISGPVFPSHSLSGPEDSKEQRQLNHWCEEINSEDDERLNQEINNDQKSKIMKVAPTSYIN